MITQLCLTFEQQQEQQQESTIQLYDYQQQVINDTYALLRQGIKRILIYSATGSGKTVIACWMVRDAIKKGRQLLFVVDKDCLLDQTRETLEEFGLKAGFIKANLKENRSLPIQIASLQSLARREFPQHVDIIIADEAHTSCWHKTYESLKQTYPNSIQIGLSATPWRMRSSEYFSQHFDAIVFAPSLKQLIAMRRLAQPRYYSWGGLLDLSELDDGKDGDFHESQLKAICLNPKYNKRIVDEFLNICPERISIAFSTSVEQSKLLCELFNNTGVKAEHIDYNTNHSERKAMFARAKEGKTQVLCSVTALTTGFNLAEIGCVLLCRPTKSKALLHQMAGRGLRTHKNKVDCLILDFGGNFVRHGFLTDNHKVQLQPVTRKVRPTTKECPECHQVISIFALICPHCGYEFAIPIEDEEIADEATDEEFGEIFDLDQKQKILFLRKQIRYLYQNNRIPDRIWEIFDQRWGCSPSNSWHQGAVFGCRNTEVNRQKYLDYLHTVNPNAKDAYWYQFHMELEFGKRETWSKQEARQQARQQAREQTRQYRNNYYQHQQADDFKRLMWWEVLEVKPPVDKAQVKAAYMRLLKIYHPDVSKLSEEDATERTKLINLAYEQALKFI